MILNNIFYAAGVLFYTKMPDSSMYFLLGKNYDNKWSDFGVHSFPLLLDPPLPTLYQVIPLIRSKG